MDVKEDNHIQILLRKPFLATIRAIMEVKRGQLTFEFGKEKIKFILPQFMKTPVVDDTRYFVDIIDECIKELTSEAPTTKELDVPSTKELKEGEDDDYREYLYVSLKECLSLYSNSISISIATKDRA